MGKPVNIIDLPWPTSAGRILDPYAGNRRWWKKLDTRNVTFVDRFVIMPGTIQGDCAALPFRDKVFDQVWADPPHFIRKSRFAPSCQLSHFGAYPTRAAVHSEWRAAAKELYRVTKPAADLIWKVIDGAKTVNQCVCFADTVVLAPWWEFIDDLRVKSAVSWSSAYTVFTHWKRRMVD